MPLRQEGRAAKQPAREASLMSSIWDGVHMTGEEPKSAPELEEGTQEGEGDGRKDRSNPNPRAWWPGAQW